MSELLSFRGGRNTTVEAERAGTKENKGKSAALPDILSERSESSPLFFAVQRRKARREEEESVRYLKRRFVKRPGTIPPRAATTGFDGVLITKTTTFEQSWNGAKKSQLHAIGNSHERASTVAALPL